MTRETGLSQQLADKLAALQSDLGSLELEICNADLQLAEMESSQRELLRRRECAGERVRIVFAEIQEVEAKINAIKASKEGMK